MRRNRHYWRIVAHGRIATDVRLRTVCRLPPIDGFAGGFGGGLVVLEVGEHGCIDTDMERITPIRAEGDERCGHRPAVQVTRDVEVRIGELLRLEVI